MSEIKEKKKRIPEDFDHTHEYQVITTGNIRFPCSADHVQDRQPYPVDPYSCYMCDHTYIL